MPYAKSLDEFYNNLELGWKKELILKLRKIILSTELKETLKWGVPVFVYNKKNIVGLASFKKHCAIWFYQGGLLKDKEQLLFNAQEGKTKALRQWRFLENDPVPEKKIKSYVVEAIQNQKEGKEIKPDKTKKEIIIPELMAKEFEKNKELKKIFSSLSYSHQKEYVEHIHDAKKESTKVRRLEKIIPMILDKKGLHDKYKNC